MKLGVLTVALGDQPFDKALDFLEEQGVEMIEVGCGGHPGTAHCDPEILLHDDEALKKFRNTVEKHHMEISAHRMRRQTAYALPARRLSALLLFYGLKLLIAGAIQSLKTLCRRRPLNSVVDYLFHILVEIGGERLMSGLEIEYFSVSSYIATARTESFSALVPAEQYNLLGFGYAERFSVHFLMLYFKIFSQALCYRVSGIYNPNSFHISVLSPTKVTGCTHKSFERL